MLPPPQAFSIACAVAGTAISFMVVLTGVLFRSMMRSVVYRTIFTIALCDFCGNFMLSFGFPSGALCSSQGFIGYLFIRASWFFTVCLSLQLCSLVLYGRIVVSEVWLHLCSWSLTLFLSLIPFAGGFDPGLDDFTYGTGWCFLAMGGHDSATTQSFILYSVFYFIVPLLGSLFLLVLFSTIVIFYITCRQNSSGNVSTTQLKSLVFTMLLYPLALLITWVPSLVAIIYDTVTPLTQITVQDFTIAVYFNALGSIYSSLLGIIFFTNSREARQRWYYLFVSQVGQTSNINVVVDTDLENTLEEHRRSSQLSSASKRSSLGIGGHPDSVFGMKASDVDVISTISNPL